MHVRKDRLNAFHDFQSKIDILVRLQPGFSGREVISPVEGLQDDWVILFRFDTNENLQNWLHLPERSELLAKVQEALEKPLSLQIVATDPGVSLPAAAVFSHRIKPGREKEFAEWRQRITQARTHAPGHLDSEMFEPVPGVQKEWVSIVRFSNAARLDAWMKSPIRKKLLEEADSFTELLQARPMATGLESWFSLKGKAGDEENPVPIWKQSLLVLLALYPTTMVIRTLTDPFLSGVDRAIQILAGNVIGVAVLAWILMPRISRWLGFWLHPRPETRRWKTNLIGLGLVVFLIAALFCGSLLLERLFG